MTQPDRDLLQRLAPAGHYIALRIRFAFPREEHNHMPKGWLDLYTNECLVLDDPAIRWAYRHVGTVRWQALPDPAGILARARRIGLVHGAVAAVADAASGQRSFGMFLQDSREHSDRELQLLHAEIARLHDGAAPPGNLTRAEIEVLRMVKNGYRLKQIAHALGVTEGAIKQRLKNARTKLGANTATQAATMAAGFRLI